MLEGEKGFGRGEKEKILLRRIATRKGEILSAMGNCSQSKKEHDKWKRGEAWGRSRWGEGAVQGLGGRKPDFGRGERCCPRWETLGGTKGKKAHERIEN